MQKTYAVKATDAIDAANQIAQAKAADDAALKMIVDNEPFDDVTLEAIKQYISFAKGCNLKIKIELDDELQDGTVYLAGKEEDLRRFSAQWTDGDLDEEIKDLDPSIEFDDGKSAIDAWNLVYIEHADLKELLKKHDLQSAYIKDRSGDIEIFFADALADFIKANPESAESSDEADDKQHDGSLDAALRNEEFSHAVDECVKEIESTYDCETEWQGDAYIIINRYLN